MFWLVTSPHIPLLSLKLPNVGGCCSRIPSLSVGQIAIVRGEVSEPTLMKRSGESLAQLPVAEEGTSEKAAAAAARRNETTKKIKKTLSQLRTPKQTAAKGRRQDPTSHVAGPIPHLWLEPKLSNPKFHTMCSATNVRTKRT
jgi:hypothetical protein